MPPKKKAPTTSKRTSRASTSRTSAAKKAPAKRTRATTAKKATPAGTAKKAARAVKKAAQPMTRAAAAAKRTTTRSTPKRTTTAPEGAIKVLTDDHRHVEDLFARFEKTGHDAHQQRAELVARITEALSVHAAIEEEIFYPAARRFVTKANDDVLEALEEHHLVKLTLAELELMDPAHERYGAKVTVLIESVRHHVEEEEGQLFPAVRKAIDTAQLRALGDELTAAKATAPTRPHPEAPDTPPGNIVAQVLTAPLDVAANLNKAAARRVRDIVT